MQVEFLKSYAIDSKNIYSKKNEFYSTRKFIDNKILSCSFWVIWLIKIVLPYFNGNKQHKIYSEINNIVYFRFFIFCLKNDFLNFWKNCHRTIKNVVYFRLIIFFADFLFPIYFYVFYFRWNTVLSKFWIVTLCF